MGMLGGSSKFRSYAWDPLLILAQMIAMQSVFYFGLGTVMYSLAFFQIEEISLDRIFIRKPGLKLDVITMCAHITNAIITSVGLWYIIQRSKLCLDFTATIHLFHLIITFLYAEFPSFTSWWVLTIISAVITTCLGEYLCRKTELEDIPIMGGRNNETAWQGICLKRNTGSF